MRSTLLALAASAALEIPTVAQPVNPSDPHSAAGGVMAQAGPTPTAPAAAPTTTPTSARQPMGEAAIRDRLRAMGYTDLDGVERHGEAGFRVREARRWGERVEHLAVDATTGEVTNARPMDERQIRTMLRETGSTNIRDIRPDGNHVRVRAERNNREHDLRIDPRVGILDQPGAGR